MYDIDSPGSNVNLLDSVMFPPVGHRIEWTTTPELASTVAVVDVVSTHTSAAFVVALYGVSEEVQYRQTTPDLPVARMRCSARSSDSSQLQLL
jgi:hypothetical protein